MFNIKSLSDSSEDKVTDLAGEAMNKVSLFIDDAAAPSFCNLNGASLIRAYLGKANLNGAILTNSEPGASEPE